MLKSRGQVRRRRGGRPQRFDSWAMHALTANEDGLATLATGHLHRASEDLLIRDLVLGFAVGAKKLHTPRSLSRRACSGHINNPLLVIGWCTQAQANAVPARQHRRIALRFLSERICIRSISRGEFAALQRNVELSTAGIAPPCASTRTNVSCKAAWAISIPPWLRSARPASAQPVRRIVNEAELWRTSGPLFKHWDQQAPNYMPESTRSPCFSRPSTMR